ncbi:hypothetical protein N9L68_08665 [bacterium]|nr:hypothetical protein [bacterium]
MGSSKARSGCRARACWASSSSPGCGANRPCTGKTRSRGRWHLGTAGRACSTARWRSRGCAGRQKGGAITQRGAPRRRASATVCFDANAERLLIHGGGWRTTPDEAGVPDTRRSPWHAVGCNAESVPLAHHRGARYKAIRPAIIRWYVALLAFGPEEVFQKALRLLSRCSPPPERGRGSWKHGACACRSCGGRGISTRRRAHSTTRGDQFSTSPTADR